MNEMYFDGPEYDHGRDCVRLSSQYRRIFELMRDREWRTLLEIKAVVGSGEASISAQLRHMRKDRFGSHTVNRRARGDRSNGLFEYQLLINLSSQPSKAARALPIGPMSEGPCSAVSSQELCVQESVAA